MNGMEAQECIRILLSSQYSVKEKAESFGQYIQWHEALTRNMKLKVREGRKYAFRRLFESLRNEDQNAEEKLKSTIKEIGEYWDKEEETLKTDSEVYITKLRSLSPGTPIVIRNENREDIVRFIEMRKTRFICEYQDGRRYSVSARLFVKLHKGETSKPLSEEESQQRDLVRVLGGGGFESAKEEILEKGIELLPVLLDELAASINRVENAPAGITKGVLGSFLGPVKKVNPHDMALIKRVPEIIAEIATRVGENELRRRIEEYPNAKVRDLCYETLSKGK